MNYEIEENLYLFDHTETMSENATHIIIRHYIDGASTLYFSMICCMILIGIVILVVCSLLGIVIYLVLSSRKSQQSARDHSLERAARQRENHSAENFMEDPSSLDGAGISVSASQEIEAGTDSNAIPLTTFRRHTVVNGRVGECSESSAGLYEVLFPGEHRGEIISDPPKRLVTFAGQVYASGESSTRTNLMAGPSTSGITCDDASGSLEWDYFEQDNQTGSAFSEGESETEVKRIKNICWV